MHPLATLSPRRARRLFWLCFAATASVGAALVALGGPLKTAAAPAGVFSLELNFGRLPAMYASYDAATKAILGFQLGLDYLFMPLYSTGLILGLVGTLQRRAAASATPNAPTVIPRWFSPLAWVVWGAGACDAAENAFLYAACLRGATSGLGWGATIFAAIKFAILIVALLAWAVVALRRRQPATRV